MVHLTTALDASSGVPLYEQLYRSLAGEMRSGTLAAGTRMPGKRRLAAELSVSGEYGGCRLSDAGGGRVSGIAGAQRLLCTGISGPAVPACRRAGTARTAKIRNRLCCRCGTTFPPAG